MTLQPEPRLFQLLTSIGSRQVFLRSESCALLQPKKKRDFVTLMLNVHYDGFDIVSSSYINVLMKSYNFLCNIFRKPLPAIIQRFIISLPWCSNIVVCNVVSFFPGIDRCSIGTEIRRKKNLPQLFLTLGVFNK